MSRSVHQLPDPALLFNPHTIHCLVDDSSPGHQLPPLKQFLVYPQIDSMIPLVSPAAVLHVCRVSAGEVKKGDLGFYRTQSFAGLHWVFGYLEVSARKVSVQQIHPWGVSEYSRIVGMKPHKRLADEEFLKLLYVYTPGEYFDKKRFQGHAGLLMLASRIREGGGKRS